MVTQRKHPARLSLGALLTALFLILSPGEGVAQLEASAGMLVVGTPSDGGGQIGPMLSVSASSVVLGIPAFLEVGAGRTDFTSLGQDYHHNHYLIAVGAEWFATGGPTRLALRFGVGAYGELETVETDPPSDGGGGWVETVVAGLVVERDIGHGRRLVARAEDAVLGPWLAVLDPSEYDIDHRFRFLLGIRF